MVLPPPHLPGTHPHDAPEPESATDLQPGRVLAEPGRARLAGWGVRAYADILRLQEALRSERRAGAIPDTWLFGEHPTVITQGVRASAGDLLAAPALAGYPVFQIDRGGQTTVHTPGQLVVYPIVRTQPGMLAQARASRLLLASVRAWLAGLLGLALEAPRGRPGLFWQGRKVAAIGLSIRGGVSMHGIAVNCDCDLAPWRAIVPCGEPETRPETLSTAAGAKITAEWLGGQLPGLLRTFWGYETLELITHPEWPATP